jgi:type IV secretion system protein VirB4
MLGNSGWRERSADRYLPYVGHAREHVLLLKDSSGMCMLEMHGTPYELEEIGTRNARYLARNTLFRTIADDNVALVSYLVRHEHVPPLPPRKFRSAFARQLDAQYRERVLDGRLHRNQWFLSIVVSPRTVMNRWAAAKLAKMRRVIPDPTDQVLQTLEDLVAIIMRGMAEYEPRLLGLREEDGVIFSEPAEALRLILTGRYLSVPLVSGYLGSAIYTDRIITGIRGFEIRPPGKSYFGTILTLRDYPSPKTIVGMLNPVLGLACSLVLTQSFLFHTRARTQAEISLKHAQMETAEDAAVSQKDALLQAKDDIASNAYVNGSHHLSLTLFGATLEEVKEHAAKARAVLTGAGAVFTDESLGLEAALWSQLSGNWEWRTRPGIFSSRNFSALSTFDNYPAGNPAGYWGDPLIRFRTRGGTYFDYILHVMSVGHTVLFGPTGTGKTVFLLFLLAMLEQAMVDRPGSIVLFDKDAGGEIMVRATGGRYLRLRKGEPSGLAPLRRLEDTPASYDFLLGWISALICTDGGRPLLPEEEGRLERGIRRQLKLPKELRSLAGLREFLGHADPGGAGARLEKWCRGGALGWAFDNDEDETSLDGPIVGFDLGAMLDPSMSASPVSASMAAYLLHRVQSIMDGRRFVLAADEFWMYLANPLFANALDNFLLTLRKINGSLILATQQPEHALSRPIGASLVAQCMTKILFPNRQAVEASYNALGCSPAVFRAVHEDLLEQHAFVLMRDSGSVICDFDLSALPEQLATLSGTLNRVKLLDEIRRSVGDDPRAFLPEYQRRYAEAVD